MSGRRGAMVSKSQSLLDLLLAHNRTLSLLLTSDVASAEMVAAANEDLLYQLGERNDTFWLEAMSSTSSSSSSSIPNTTSLEMMLGPVRDSYPTVILMTIVYVLILLTGVTGNVITCLVIAKKRYMHTATNYYLFSLAVSDLLLLVLGLPQDLVLVWQRYPYAFGESFCILRGLTSELSTNASILTITAFTIERYVAICHPLRSHTTLKLARVVKTIVVIWVIGALSAAPIAYQFGIIRLMDDTNKQYLEGSDMCAVKHLLYPYIFEITTMVFFVVPICIITILYILIGIRLRASSKSNRSIGRSHQHPQHRAIKFSRQQSSTSSASAAAGSSSGGGSGGLNRFQGGLAPPPSSTTTTGEGRSQLSMSVRRQNASRRAVIKMLVAVVIAFFFCYSPFHAQRVMAMALERNQAEGTSFVQIFTIVTHISGVTYYLSSTINPILYQVMSKKFRLALRETLSCCRRRPSYNDSATDYEIAYSTALATPSSKQGSLQRKNHHASNYRHHQQQQHQQHHPQISPVHQHNHHQPPPVFVISNNSLAASNSG